MNSDVHTNRLIHESSPYLLLHAHNPVDWFPWGEEALSISKKGNKLLIISIGYAACHWCHVMEEESFGDEEVATLMNAHFVSIKVDREERPDIDQVYMNAAQLMSGRGGWPLNVIALPDGRPIYIGTYFPKDQWKSLLSQTVDIYKQDYDKVIEQAEGVTKGLQRIDILKVAEQIPDFYIDDLHTIVRTWMNRMDPEWGGEQSAPKFPMPAGLRFLLDYAAQTQNEGVLRMVKLTLDRMALGGIYDQIGGGFARYSVDGYWKVPHFEKMLYDNGQLVSLYSTAYQLTKEPFYKEIVYETLRFIGREMTSPDGGFYSSLDADSEGEEGKYYVWTIDEIDGLFGDEADLVKSYYSMRREGNWEDSKNVLFRSERDEDFASRKHMKVKSLQNNIEKAKQKMFEARSGRRPPAVDDKILVSWNALMLKGFVDAYRAFHDADFLESALKNGNFIVRNMLSEDNRLNRNFKDGISSVNGFLDDYAFTIAAFVALYESTFDETWLYKANDLLTHTLTHFFDPDQGLFYYKSDLDPELIARNMEVSDNVIPASNSVMAHNLFLLGHYLSNEDYIVKARRMLSAVKPRLVTGGAYYSNWSRLMLRLVMQVYEVAIVGEDCFEKRKELDHHFLPDMILSGSIGESLLPLLKDKFKPEETTVYVCRDKVCQQPVSEIEDALLQMEKVH